MSPIGYEKVAIEDASDSGAAPLLRAEDEAFHERLPARKSKLQTMRLVLVLELCHLCLALVGYGVYSWVGYGLRSGQQQQRGLDSYYDLGTYNSSRSYQTGVRDAADATPEAEAFWDSVMHGGIVEIPDDWVAKMGLEKSVPHPYEPNKSIYQVDAFHSIHCLYRIRNRLLSKVPIDQWWRDDPHTMHCLDHIRLILMCHADLTLHSSEDYIFFDGFNQNLKCRDWSAVTNWTLAHTWGGYRDYLYGVIQYSAADVESMLQTLLELKPQLSSNWDLLVTKQGKTQGDIDVWADETFTELKYTIRKDGETGKIQIVYDADEK